MAGINTLREILDKKGEDFLNSLLNNYVIINEKIDGTFFGLKKGKNDDFKYFKKSGEISYVDRVLMKYYNPAISYFTELSLEKRQRIPSNFYFGFEYFTRGDAADRGFKKAPKNNLILSYIHKLDDSNNVISTVQNKEQLNRWADYLEVERPPIIFEGKLTDDQKADILDFVHADPEKLLTKFKTKSFTKYIISILNPEDSASSLDKTIDNNLETIIFRFYDESSESPEAKVFLAKLMDPIFQKKLEENKPKENQSQDYIWLIVIDLMNHIEMYDSEELSKFATAGNNYDEKYILLINQVFKDFIKEYSKKYEGLQLEIPEYLKRPEFELNYLLIKDKSIESLIKNNETYTEIYKILLNFFRRTRKKVSAGFFNVNLLTQLNLIVGKLKNIIMGEAVYEGLFPSFGEFVGNYGDSNISNEEESVKNYLSKSKPISVNILIGTFQPITIGHINAAKKLNKSNNKKTLFIAIKQAKPTVKSPFSVKQTETMMNKVKNEYPNDIIGIKIIPSGQIEEIIDVIQPEYKPELWGTTEKRIKDYALQLDYIKKRKIPLKYLEDFKLIELPSYIKSEDVIKIIKDSDFSEFKKNVPKSIFSEFFNLQKELTSLIKENVSISNIQIIGNVIESDNEKND